MNARRPHTSLLLQLFVDDLLIQTDITKKQDQEGISPEPFTLNQSELHERFIELCSYMRRSMGSLYDEWFTDRGLSEEDLKTFLQIPLRRDMFAKYLHNQMERQELGKWLEKQRKKARYGPDGTLDLKEVEDWLQKQFS